MTKITIYGKPAEEYTKQELIDFLIVAQNKIENLHKESSALSVQRRYDLADKYKFNLPKVLDIPPITPCATPTCVSSPNVCDSCIRIGNGQLDNYTHPKSTATSDFFRESL